MTHPSNVDPSQATAPAAYAFTAVLQGHQEADNVSLLHWHGLTLKAPLAIGFSPGELVRWSIPPDQVRLLSNTGRPLSPDDTLFTAVLVEVVETEGLLRVQCALADAPAVVVVMEADTLIARAHGVQLGASLTLRLRGRGIRVGAPAAQ